jgi:hypothetical protein
VNNQSRANWYRSLRSALHEQRSSGALKPTKLGERQAKHRRALAGPRKSWKGPSLRKFFPSSPALTPDSRDVGLGSGKPLRHTNLLVKVNGDHVQRPRTIGVRPRTSGRCRRTFVCCRRTFVCCRRTFVCCRRTFVCCRRTFVCCRRTFVRCRRTFVRCRRTSG